jgi:porin
LRDQWAAHGFTIDFVTSYTLQGVPSGGLPGGNNSLGNTFNGDLVLNLDTGKAGLWQGGFFKLRLDGRVGQSDLTKAATVSPANAEALFPDAPGLLDQPVLGLTELTYTQFLSPNFGVFGGLLNTLDGDNNAIAGDARNVQSFFNLSFLMSPVEMAGAPNVSLGGGAVLIVSPDIFGTVTVLGSEETATTNPFTHWSGTTLSTAWTFKHQIDGQPGGQTFGFLDAIGKSRANILLDPRVFIANIIVNQTIPTTHANTWAFYYNGYQYIEGDEQKGWGPFLRAGVSDADPNPVKWNIAAGIGGKGLIPGRDADGWGAGFYFIDMSKKGLLAAINIGNEVGGEAFYNIAVTPAVHATLDAQLVSSARSRQDTAWILGGRLNLDF